MIALTPTITTLLAAHAPVAIGVSGGKDSDAAAFATIEHLDDPASVLGRYAELMAARPEGQSTAVQLGMLL